MMLRKQNSININVNPKSPTLVANAPSHFWVVLLLLLLHCPYRCLAGGNGDSKAKPRIIGGERARRGDYPYFIKYGACGATLIHSDIALTAAHCKKAKYVWIGAYDSHPEEGYASFMSVEEVVIHPDYDKKTFENDVAIVKLSGAANPNSVVSLNENGNSPSGSEELTIIGFGATSEGGKGSDVLLEATVEHVPVADCKELYDAADLPVDEVSMLCAGLTGSDSCTGDSGGPLLDGDDQVGIVSWGNGCGRDEFPGVYASVSNAIEFIEESVCDYSDCPPKSCKEDPKGSYRVDVQYDAWPEDIQWAIFAKNEDEDEAIVSSSGDAGLFEHVSVYFDPDPGEYVFRIADFSGYNDGMTVDMEGYYQVVDVGRDKVVVEGRDKFKFEEHEFTVK